MAEAAGHSCAESALKDGDGKFARCLAKEDSDHYFCICNGLLSSAGYNPEDEEPLYTVGSNAYRVESVVPVKALMDELRGAATPARASAAAACSPLRCFG